MVVTERAGEMLKTILEDFEAHEAHCIRLDLSSASEGLRVDQEHDGDEVVTFEGKTVLAMDPYTAEKVAHQVLDCDGDQFLVLGVELR